MKIKLKVYAGLNKYLDPKPGIGEVVIIDLPEGSTVHDLLNTIGIPTDEVSIIFLNGVHASLDSLLPENATISVFPPVGGG